MLKLTCLKSGSEGNCHLLTNGDSTIMIDCGINIKSMGATLFENGIDVSKIDYVLISHEHEDHIQGLGFFKNKNTKILMTKALENNPRENNFLNKINYQSGDNIIWFDPIDREKGYSKPIHLKEHYGNILPIQSHHDAVDPCGFIIENNLKEKLVYITDTGYVNMIIRNAEIYLIEANYSKAYLDLLDDLYGEESHKHTRVKSLEGHLSCEDSFAYIDEYRGEKTVHVIYAHLSRTGFQNVKETFKGREYLPSQEFVAREYQVGVDNTPAHMRMI